MKRQLLRGDLKEARDLVCLSSVDRECQFTGSVSLPQNAILESLAVVCQKISEVGWAHTSCLVSLVICTTQIQKLCNDISENGSYKLNKWLNRRGIILKRTAIVCQRPSLATAPHYLDSVS